MDVNKCICVLILLTVEVVTESINGAQNKAGKSAVGQLSQNSNFDSNVVNQIQQKNNQPSPGGAAVQRAVGQLQSNHVQQKPKKRKRRRRTPDPMGIPVHLNDGKINNLSQSNNIPNSHHVKQSNKSGSLLGESKKSNVAAFSQVNLNKPKIEVSTKSPIENNIVNSFKNVESNKVKTFDINDKHDDQVGVNSNNLHAIEPAQSINNQAHQEVNKLDNNAGIEIPMQHVANQGRGDIPVQSNNNGNFDHQPDLPQQQQQQAQQQQQSRREDSNQQPFQLPSDSANVRAPYQNQNGQDSQPKKEDMRIMWDWSDFLINYEQYVMPEQKVRRAPHATTGEPWPMPQYYTAKKNKVYKLNRDKFHFRIVKESCDIIEKAIIRYKDYIINDTILDMYDNLQHAQGSSFQDLGEKYEKDIYRRAPYLDLVTVKIRRPCSKMPSDKMDESYDLFVKRKATYIWANEVWGAIKGLETFSQLVFRGVDDELYIKDTTINDYPRFQHRGILIDTSRHYLFKDVLYDVLEAMAMNKMNVLHWHIVDDQSFPYQSKVYPDLSQKGAYHPSFVYTHEDIGDIIEYARLRGIRVMPEFDTPGHTYSWGLSRPDLLTQCYQGAHPVNGYLGPLDPSKNETYRFLKNFFNEVMHVFKDQYMHLGGDEVPMTCWSSNPEVLKLLNKLEGKPDTAINLQNNDPYMYSYEIRKVLEYYEKRLTTDLKELGRKRSNGVRFVMWQEIMNNNVQLPNDTIIQIWQGDMGDVQRAIDMGYNALYSTCWYLDLIEYGVKWPKYYNCDPVDTSFGYQIDEKKVLGGEACMWAEYVDNENLMTTLWPRASAPAERLWSNKDVRDVEAAGKRLTEHRCRMLSRGLSVGMINGPDYCLRRGRRHDRDGYRNCTGDRCYRGVVIEDIEKFNVHVQQRGKSDCNQIIPSGGSFMSTFLIIIIVLMFLVTSLKLSATKMVQIRFCKNKTILLAFVGLLIVYFMCYTSLWIQVMDFKGSFEKRVKSYPDTKYS